MEFYPDGLLGSHSEIFHAVQEGSVEMGVFAPYVDIVPGGMLNWMPWTVGSYDEAAIAYAPDGILYQIMLVAWDDVGGRLIWNPPMGLYGWGNSARPVRVPDDLTDLKMRVSASLGAVKCWENMGKGTGMTLETIPWADLYNALERGVVDGCWSLWGSLVEERHFEGLKYYIALNWCWDTCNVVMNNQIWNELPADVQDIVMKAGMMAEERDYEAHRRSDLNYKKFVTEAGLQIYYPTPEEREIWRKKSNMPAIWEELCDPWLEEHYPGQNMSQKILTELDRIREEVEAAGIK